MNGCMMSDVAPTDTDGLREMRTYGCARLPRHPPIVIIAGKIYFQADEVAGKA